MRCNACWRELKGHAITTTCGHLLCTEDASKILSNDAACPICHQVLSKSLMEPVDINPNDDWTNMAMAGISPQIYIFSDEERVQKRDVLYWEKGTGDAVQNEQNCSSVSAEMRGNKLTEKLEQVHTAYQKMAKRCQMIEQEIESLSKDEQELQEKFSEKSRQKQKLDEMYDQLRSEYESIKRSAIEPVGNLFPRSEPDVFSNPANVMDNRDLMRKDWSVFTPHTPGPREDMACETE